jgi:RHS repeat-associated protein
VESVSEIHIKVIFMKAFIDRTLRYVAAISFLASCLTVNVYAGTNVPGKASDTSQAGRGSVSSPIDGDPSDSKGNPKDESKLADGTKENCSVIYKMNIGHFQTEFDEGIVYLRIKRLKPTPLLFTPQSLIFDSPLASDVLWTPESEKAQAVQEATLAVDIATADVSSAAEDEDEAEQAKDDTYANLQTKEQALLNAQTALAADPENEELQQAVVDATAARDAAQETYDTALADYNAAVALVNSAAESLTDAQTALTQAQDAYSAYVTSQQSAGTLIENDSGVALGKVEIQRPKGTAIAYEPDTADGLWKPVGEQRYYASRLKALSGSAFARIDGKGNEFIFEASEGALPQFKFPNGKTIDLNSPGVRQEIILRSGVLRQVVTPQALSDVVILDSYSYEVRLYSIDNIGVKNGSGLYEPTGEPIAKFKVENPTGDVNQLYHVRITTTKGDSVDVSDWVYYEADGGWSLVTGAGDDQVRVRKTITEVSSSEEIYQWETFDSNDQLVLRENETYTEFPWGKATTQRVKDPGGENLIETIDYYDNSSDGEKYGKLKTQVNADGSWVTYEYDSIGRESVKIEPWLNSPVGTSASGAKATYYSYSPVDGGDTLMEYDRRVRTETVKVLGQTVKKIYYAYLTNSSDEYVEIEEIAATPSSSYGASGNLRNTKTYYPDSDPEATAGRLKTEEFPDGRLDTYSYERQTDNSFVTTVTHGIVVAPAGVANKTTREIITLDPRGNEVTRETYIYTGSDYSLAETVEQDFDERGDMTERSHNGRVVYTATYEDGFKMSETNEQGIAFTYTYDSMERVKTRTKIGVDGQPDIVTTYTYNANDRMTEKTIEAGGLSLYESWTYDLADRLINYTDQGGYATSYEYEDGGRTVICTNPDTSVVITEMYVDGRVKSISGSGTVNEYYSYSVASDGSTSVSVMLGRDDSLRVTTIRHDMIGRVVEQTSPGFDGGSVVTLMTYDDRGLLVKQEQTELADILYEYDSARQLIRSGLDMNQNGTLDLASSDRISESENYFWTDTSEKWWQVNQERVYPDAGSANAVVVSETRKRLNGFDTNEASETVTLDTQRNETVVSTVTDRSTVTTIVTTDVPNSSLDGEDTYLNGLLQTHTTTSISEPRVFTYDELGRKIAEKAPRHTSAAEWDYDANTGLLVAERDAAGNETGYAYYPQGQLGAGKVASVTDALGQVAYREYNSRGQIIRVWGETEYPVEYAYNEFGERTAMTTFRSGDDEDLWIDTTWPDTPPTGDTTTWTYDEATGLLTAKTDAADESVTYTYTAAGRMAERFWARLDDQDAPLETSYTYDPLAGERTLVDYTDDTHDIAYTFDRLGRLDTVTDAAGSRSFSYNADLQIEAETISSFYGTDKRLSRTYETGTPGANLVGRYISFSVGTASDPDEDYTVAYSFDGYGRLNGVTDANSVYSYTYVTDGSGDSVSNLLATMASPVHTTTYSYETDRDLKTDVQNGAFSHYTYRYDAIGRRTDRVQQGSAFSQASFDAFDYNARSEVTGSDRYLGTDPEDTSNPLVADVFAYAFDPIGNRLSSSTAGTTENYTTNDLNQYLTAGTKAFRHDEDGNLTGDGTRSFSWTAENRLKSIEPIVLVSGAQKIEFVYDYLGRRIRKTVSEWNGSFYETVSDEKFLYDGWNLTAVYDATDNNALVKTHTWGLDLSRSFAGAGGVGGLLGAEELGGAQAGLYHYAYDVNGNVTEVLSDSGTIAAHYEYDPFGNTIYSFGTYSNANTFRFSTKYRDAEAELYYYGYRHYDPTTGRWLSRDPIQEAGGLNLYGMVNNCPIDRFDYLGMKSKCQIMKEWNAIDDAHDKINDEIDRQINEWKKGLKDNVDDTLTDLGLNPTTDPLGNVITDATDLGIGAFTGAVEGIVKGVASGVASALKFFSGW